MTIVPISQPKFRCAPDVVWTAEGDGIRLEASARALAVKLFYPEAAFWDFTVRGVSEARSRFMIMHIAGFTEEAAASTFIAQCLQDWQRQGLIVPAI